MKLTLQQVFDVAWRMALKDQRGRRGTLFVYDKTNNTVQGCYLGQALINYFGVEEAMKLNWSSKMEPHLGNDYIPFSNLAAIHDSAYSQEETLYALVEFAEKYNLNIPIEIPQGIIIYEEVQC